LQRIWRRREPSIGGAKNDVRNWHSQKEGSGGKGLLANRLSTSIQDAGTLLLKRQGGLGVTLGG